MKKLNIKVPRQLDLSLRKQLVRGRYKGQDPEELFYMQRFPKARLEPKGYSHAKVVELCRRTKYELAYGYRIFKRVGENVWKKEPYSFALDDGRVIDIDKNFSWKGADVYYIGVVVEPDLYSNLEYIKQSNTKFFKERSVFSLYEKDFLEKPKEDISNEDGG